MEIRSALNGGLCEVSEEFGAELIESGQWVAVRGAVEHPKAPAADPGVTTPEAPKKRVRRTKAQIAADEAAKNKE